MESLRKIITNKDLFLSICSHQKGRKGKDLVEDQVAKFDRVELIFGNLDLEVVFGFAIDYNSTRIIDYCRTQISLEYLRYMEASIILKMTVPLERRLKSGELYYPPSVNSFLHMASKNANEKLTEELLMLGCLQNPSVIHGAVLSNKAEFLRWLLNKQFPHLRHDKADNSILETAFKNGNEDIINQLEQLGFPYPFPFREITPNMINIAARQGHFHLVKKYSTPTSHPVMTLEN